MTGLLVGWLAKRFAKAIAANFLSGLLGSILAGVILGSATALGLPFAMLGLGLGAIYGLAFGAVAVIRSLPTSLVQRHRGRGVKPPSDSSKELSKHPRSLLALR
ncbi:MAG: hypothetical protein QW057_00560 [Candidatus Bathyarchaeia archaeon]